MPKTERFLHAANIARVLILGTMMLLVAVFAGYLFIQDLIAGTLKPAEWVIGFVVVALLFFCPIWTFHNLRAVCRVTKIAKPRKKEVS